MKKTSKVLLLATVCTAMLFAMCTKSDEAEMNVTDNVAAAQADGDPCPGHEWTVQICPGGLLFDHILNICDFAYNVPGGSPFYYQCAYCGECKPIVDNMVLDNNLPSFMLPAYAKTPSFNLNGVSNFGYGGATVNCGNQPPVVYRNKLGVWSESHTFSNFMGGMTAEVSFTPYRKTIVTLKLSWTF